MALYVTPQEIKDWLGISNSNRYSDTYLQSLIEMKMDYVDRITMTTWAGNSKQEVHYYDLTRPKWGWWIYRLGFPIYLGRLYIRSIDKLEVYDGETWEDWIASPQYEEGRQRDYWVDYINGVVYLNNFLIPQAGKEVKITYTYGRDDIPGHIKELTLLLVVKDLLMNDRTLFALAEGASGVTLQEQISHINDRIHQLEEMVRAISPAIAGIP